MRRRLTVQRLTEIVGQQAAMRLIEEWGGHDIPRLTPVVLERRKRDQQVRRFVDQHGSTFAEAARKFGLSERQVKRIGNASDFPRET